MIELKSPMAVSAHSAQGPPPDTAATNRPMVTRAKSPSARPAFGPARWNTKMLRPMKSSRVFTWSSATPLSSRFSTNSSQKSTSPRPTITTVRQRAGIWRPREMAPRKRPIMAPPQYRLRYTLASSAVRPITRGSPAKEIRRLPMATSAPT